ncbi:MAG: hypothetical protein B6245_12800 [Desulfobacteraceae bacterium 4572_88]|nr:MAG: hypothetical protein B6245_12800 [Desulfobacteraceae bacterium 4572_88]
MIQDMLEGLEPFAFLIGVFLCMLSIWRLERRYARNRYISDEEYLAGMARKRGGSEYDIFHISAKEWCIPAGRIDEDFKEYLVHGDLPYYVKDYIRKNRKKAALK